jgi:hypothetical protein
VRELTQGVALLQVAEDNLPQQITPFLNKFLRGNQ